MPGRAEIAGHPRRRADDRLAEELERLFPADGAIDSVILPTVLKKLLEGQEQCANENAELQQGIAELKRGQEAALEHLKVQDEQLAGLKTAITVAGIANFGKAAAPWFTIWGIMAACGAWLWKHYH